MFKKTLAISLALTVLVSSHSFAWFEHLCTITKIKKLSFDVESCFGEATQTPPLQQHTTLKKGSCCEITLKVNKANTAVQQNFGPAYTFLVAEEPVVPAFTFEPVTETLAEEPAFSHGDSSPPRLLPLYLLNEQFII